ncbi:MAG TPA: amino acid--[acyl-carrier-protein] ligase [Thermoanaerobaculia bacterium]|jgi:seryl-tRNA synthetase
MTAATLSLDDAYKSFRDELFDARLIMPTGVRGVYALSSTFEHIVRQWEAYATREAADRTYEVVRFPPVLARSTYLKTDHMATFPNLMGSVQSFMGDDRNHMQLANKHAAGEDWTVDLSPTEVMMAPASCYPIYAASTGTLPPGGRAVDLGGYVFRHEPSDDPARMQIFRMREFVRIGTPDEALEHRNYWLAKGEQMLRAAGLDVQPVIANDPFFGRGGRVMAATQREQELKYELVVPVASAEKPTAVASANYHLDHFSVPFDIKTADGEVAHSACLGFGLERVTLALFRKHGFDPAQWPASVRNVLAL